MALGAHTSRILRMVLRQGAWQVGLGLLAGMGLTFTLATLAATGIQGTLYGVSGRDPWSYGVVTTLIAIVAVVAMLVPAQRATRVDPMVALRTQ
jgi:ABC-type antimicrobial peptide transport system permease subunit